MKRKQNTYPGLKSLRTFLGLTQEGMALKLGISTSLVKMIETNQRSLSVTVLMKLAKIQIDLSAYKKM